MVWATLLGFLCLLAFLVRSGGAPAPLPGASADEVRQLFCRELKRQSRLRSFLVWWWLTPLFMGLALHFILVRAEETLQARQVMGVLLMAALAACVCAFNSERAEMVRRKARTLEPAAP